MASFEPSPDLDPAVAQAIRQAMDALRAELLPHLPAPETQPPAESAAEAAGERRSDRLRLLEEALGALDAAPSQALLLSELLQQAGRFADRAVFLVLDDGRFGGWAAYGFDTDQDGVTRAGVDAGADAWAEVARGTAAAELDSDACGAIVDQLGGSSAAGGVLVGFPLRGSTAGALYADQLEAGGPLDPSALRILTYVAAQALETLPLRRGPQAEPDAKEETAAPLEAETALEEPVEPVEPVSAETAEVDIDEMLQEVEVGERADQEVLEIRQDVAPPPFETAAELGAAVIDEVEEGATPELDVDGELPEPHEEPEAGGEDGGFATQEISTVETTLEESPETPRPAPRPLEPAEVAPPADLDGPGWAFGGAGTITDDTRREEARRLARLLVTEIKLYNEEKVREGREQNNLVDQLRDDLDRSRRIYEERIDEEIRSETDYFQEECLRILAGGDSTALGV